MVTEVITPAELEFTLNDDTTADETFDEVALEDDGATEEIGTDDNATELASLLACTSLLDCAALLGILDEAAVVVLPPPPPPQAVNTAASVVIHSSD